MAKDLNAVGAVCDECARKAGYVPKNKVVGVWVDHCGICNRVMACTDLHHDWKKKEENK